jgi:phosphoenolpyruvate carboxykinase (ATP)
VGTLNHCVSNYGLDACGVTDTGLLHWNLSADELIDLAVAADEGTLSESGALCVTTGECTGRRPADRFIVREPGSENDINWGKVNLPIAPEVFDTLHAKIINHYKGKTLFARECLAGADPANQLKVRVVNESAWHNLFARQLFIVPEDDAIADFVPDWTILNAPWLDADPTTDGTRTNVFVIIHPAKKLVIIGGTQYAGEIKKSIFSVMNYILPLRGVLSMHCSANIGQNGDVALFFGLSGTGKTTLSADPNRKLIGDDEHGWSENGVFNFEGGCYAKCINLTRITEPQIFDAIRRGAVLENIILDANGAPDYHDDSLTENTRAAYPLSHIENAVFPSVGGHPKNVVFLTCDAFGVLPPISRLNPEQAMYHFMSGYTAKVAGTEAGVTEPQATFSACFGAPFLPLAPTCYATLLGEKLAKYNATCWLLNTGWSGGSYGVGKRMKLEYTRAILTAALNGTLDNATYTTDPVFGCQVPTTCPGVPDEALIPRNAWSDKNAYDEKAKKLAALFVENFKSYKKATPNIIAAGPKL